MSITRAQLPGVERMRKVDLRIVKLEVPAQEAITRETPSNFETGHAAATRFCELRIVKPQTLRRATPGVDPLACGS